MNPPMPETDLASGHDPPGPSGWNWGRWCVFSMTLLAVGWFFLAGPDEHTVIARSTAWRAAAREQLFVTVVVFFLLEVVLVGLSLPVSFWLTVLAGFLFGTGLGTVVVSFASTSGAVVAFLAARYVYAGTIRRAAAKQPRLSRWLARIDRGLQEHGVYYVLLLRLTPLIPFWFINMGLAVTSVRLRDIWWASQVGMLPVTAVVCHAGASLAEITSFRDVLSFNVLVALGLLPVVPLVLHFTAGRWLMRSAADRA
jgi:uncharacterized membrane protein YdjX (TVP38/TMEM64 family)